MDSTRDTQPTDGEIAAAVLAGDRDRFALIVRRYHRALLRLATQRMGDEQAAEDAVQEAFLAAFRSLHTYNSRYSFRTWLWTILINQCNRSLAKAARRKPKSEAESVRAWEREIPDPSGGTPAVEAAAKDQAMRLRQLIQALTPEQSGALELRFYGGLKYHEIADAMGCSLNTAKNRVRAGLQRIADKLKPREPNRTTAQESSPENRT